MRAASPLGVWTFVPWLSAAQGCCLDQLATSMDDLAEVLRLRLATKPTKPCRAPNFSLSQSPALCWSVCACVHPAQRKKAIASNRIGLAEEQSE